MRLSPLMFGVSLFLVVLVLVPVIYGKDQYVTPMNMGMKVSIPYDIANLFNRFPIQGALSVLLSMCFCSILFFGVITSPFGYFFGIPSQKYVLGDLEVGPPTTTEASRRVDDFYRRPFPFPVYQRPAGQGHFVPSHLMVAPRSLSSSSVGEILSFENSTGTESLPLRIPYTSMFTFFPPTLPQPCKLLTTCYAHRTLPTLPPFLLKVYRMFSQRLANIPKDIRDAITLGLKGDPKDDSTTANSCILNYEDDCPIPLALIGLQSIIHLIPKEEEGINRMWKRKQAMYM